MQFIKRITKRANTLLSATTGLRLVRTRQYREELGQYDRWHEQQALDAVEVIERHNGQTLSPQIKKLADDYANDVFGGRAYAPWLYVYALVRGQFKEGWIPDNFFGEFVVPRANKALRSVTAFKTFSNIVLRTTALPDLGYHLDGIFYDSDFTKTDLQAIRKKAAERSGEVFIKKDEVDRGEGVIRIALEDVTEDRLKRFGNCVIQSPIKQHSFFDRIIAGPVATIRITTVREPDGTFAMRAAYLRVGRKDTPWVQSANSVSVAILDRTGALDSCCYTQDWRRWPGHPDTGFVFANRTIPHFEAAADTCVRLHVSVPHFAVIGWDVAITEEGSVQLIEWNGEHTGIKFSEATTGPCFTGLGWEKLAG